MQFALLPQIQGVEIHLCIVDSGADSHVGGLQGWLPLVDLNWPCIIHVNVVGYCHETTKKNGLPVGDMVTKVITQDEKIKFLRARHMTVNANSKHTLLNPIK